jgi:hypothetical protein
MLEEWAGIRPYPPFPSRARNPQTTDRRPGRITREMHMLLSNNPAIDQLLVPSVILFFLISGVFAVGIGVGLIFFSPATLRFFATMNRYVSTRHAFKPLAVLHSVEEPVRRNRFVFGALIFAGAAYSLFGLLMKFDTAAIGAVYGMYFPGGVAGGLLETVRWFMIVLTSFALVIGVMLVLFPNALRSFERRANHWYSVRQLTLGADTMHLVLDRRVADFPRAFGLVLLVGALFVVGDCAILLSSL